MIKVSVIVPIYNEEKTLVNVVKTLLQSDLVDEVICVNDGSTDKSLKLLKEFSSKIILIDLKKNKGKGFALSEGIKKANGEIVAFFDADLVNLSKKHAGKLVKPLIKKQTRFTIGYRSSVRYFAEILTILSGERAYFKKDLMPYLNSMRKSRFGVEVFLNNVFKKKKKKIISLWGIKGLYKYEKRSVKIAIREYLNEGIEIASELVKQEKLSFSDRLVIRKLKKAVNIEDLKNKINELSNKKIKFYFKEYILKYIK